MLSSTVPTAGVRLIDFNRADKHNALNAALYDELAVALGEAHADPACRAVVLAGSGKSFCAGNDLADFDNAWPQPAKGPVYRFLRALYEIDVPVIAGVQGAAIGIGATLLLQCDVIFAAPAAFLRFPFIDIGIVLEGGSSHLLMERLGRARAMEILLSGRKIAAEEAARLGLVSGVVEDPVSVARAFAADVAGKMPDAVRATKRLVRSSTREIFPARFDQELMEVNRLLAQRQPR